MFGKSQEIADLQASLASVTAERDQLAARATEFQSTIETITAERDAATAEASERVASAESAAAARIAEIEAATQARVDAEVINRLASAGTDPIAREPEATSNPQTLTRAEFKKLKPAAQSEFCRAGGKIQD